MLSLCLERWPFKFAKTSMSAVDSLRMRAIGQKQTSEVSTSGEALGKKPTFAKLLKGAFYAQRQSFEISIYAILV